jgi:hypothetical protein
MKVIMASPIVRSLMVSVTFAGSIFTVTGGGMALNELFFGAIGIAGWSLSWTPN